MWQKNCSCQTIHPTCCQGGWSIITCSSRFCTAAETRYHPIEGELLWVTWALQKTAYYTLGSDKLLVLVDHKPLLGLLATNILGDIENPRLIHLAERLMRWKFTIRHIAGAKNYGPDALSRSPSSGEQSTRSGTSSRLDYTGQNSAINAISQDIQNDSDDLEAQVLATTVNNQLLLTSWNDLKVAGIADEEYVTLLNAVNSDLQKTSWPQNIQEYKKHRDDLTSVDGLITFKGRAVVPLSLRHKILKALHRSHQGVSGMNLQSTAQPHKGYRKHAGIMHHMSQECPEPTTPTPSCTPTPRASVPASQL